MTDNTNINDKRDQQASPYNVLIYMKNCFNFDKYIDVSKEDAVEMKGDTITIED